MLAIFPVGALDDGRFHWSRMSWWFVGLGYLLLIVGMAITAWAQAVNRFFEPGMRIQTERGHHVVDTGPYAIIRHPGYFAACLLFSGHIPLHSARQVVVIFVLLHAVTLVGQRDPVIRRGQ